MPLFFLVGEHTELYRLFVRTTCCKFGGSAFGVCWHKGRKSWNWGPCDLPNSTFCQLLFPFPVPVSSWREKASPTKQAMVLMVTTTLLLGRGGNPNYNIWIHMPYHICFPASGGSCSTMTRERLHGGMGELWMWKKHRQVDPKGSCTECYLVEPWIYMNRKDYSR